MNTKKLSHVPKSVRLNRINLSNIVFHITVVLYLFSQLMWSNDGRTFYIRLVHLTSLLLIAVCLWGCIVHTFDLKLNNFHIWLFIYTAYFLSTVLWCESIGYARFYVINLIKSAVICMLITLNIHKGINYKGLFRDLIIVAFLSLVYVGAHMTMKNFYDIVFSNSRFGVYGIQKVNSNRLALLYSFSIFFIIYLKGFSKKKLIHNILIVILCFFVFLTKSKTGLFLSIFFIFCEHVLLTDRKTLQRKHLLSSFVVIIVIFTLIVGVFKIPFLYNLVGWRIKSAIYVILGLSDTDASTNIRLQRWFFSTDLLTANIFSSFFGVGIGQYLYWNEIINQTPHWAESYFFQILAEGGLLGVMIHYSIFAYLSIRYRSKRSSWGIILLVAVIMVELVASDYGEILTLIYIYAAYCIISNSNDQLLLTEKR